MRRGVCTFVEKAKNIQLALGLEASKALGGTATKDSQGRRDRVELEQAAVHTPEAIAPGSSTEGGMVLLNGEDALADMPAGNLLTDDVRIPVAMRVLCVDKTPTGLSIIM